MDRNKASQLARTELDKHGLSEWGIRLTTDATKPFLGLCVYKDKTIYLNAHHIDTHPDFEIKDTILHEIAHALTPGHQHDSVWREKAAELGATPQECSTYSLKPEHIDAIRSGATIEWIEETITTHRPRITRLQDKCPDCGKVAVEKFSVDTVDKEGNQVKLITLECFHIIKKIIPKATPFESFMSNGWDDKIKSCKHEWPLDNDEAEKLRLQTNQCKKCKEFKLLDFQVAGAKAAEIGLATQKGFGIFDDMGLGKTVQALAVIKFHKEYTPTLYIVKSAIKFQWFKQIIRWLGPEYMAQAIETSKDFIYPGLKSYIVSYDLLRRLPREKIVKLGIKCVVLDECQQIKNPDSSRTKEVRSIVGQPNVKVLPLSGTPWKNRGDEFFPVLNMLSPTRFYSLQAYLDRWVDFYYQGDKRKQGGIRQPEKFREFISDIVIRREFDEVIKQFPSVNRMVLNVQLDQESQLTYDESVSEFVQWYNQAVIDGVEESLSSIELLGRMAKMRHICGLAKIPATIAFAEEFAEDTDRKLVIFRHHEDVGKILHSDLSSKFNFPVLEFTGQMSDAEKYEVAEAFNRLPRAFMIASTLAAGEGVDMQSCADAYLHERQWNPQNEDQAAPGRFKRIGQKSPVINVTAAMAEGTMDDFISGLIEQKRQQFYEVMNKSSVPVWNESAFAKELASCIVGAYNKKMKVKSA